MQADQLTGDGSQEFFGALPLLPEQQDGVVVGELCQVNPLVCFGILDASDEDEPKVIGIFSDLEEAIAGVQAWVEAVPRINDHYLRIEIQKIPLNEIDANNHVVWECEWEWDKAEDRWQVSASDDPKSEKLPTWRNAFGGEGRCL